MKYDVTVAGGGPAGVSAAISVARQGAKTLLVENNGFCGGMATAGLVGTFMTCYDANGEQMIIRGLFEETVDRMVERGFAIHPKDVMGGFRLIVDSDLDREYTEGNPDVLNISTMLFKRADYNHTSFGFPKCMIKSFEIQILGDDGEWKTVYTEDKNHQRMIKGIIDTDTTAVRLIPKTTYFSETLWNTYGSAQVHLFAFDLY